jgi:FAD/FMN-containing dehydrogenase
MKRREFVRSGLTVMGAAMPGAPALFRFMSQNPTDVEAITGDGEEITLRGAAIKALGDRLRGGLLLANDDGYDQARQILNPSFDKHPALIARVAGTADIRAAVEFAAERNLLLAVKCGGHSFSGKSTCDRGMMIDLSPFRHVRVDPEARRARVTGGSLLGALDHESMAYGLVSPMGTVSHTGVGGLVTGGGFGRLARRFGLSIDNLLAVDVVTANGDLVHASADENPDLYWGVRGGGGNFGIVTSFEFQLHPMQRQVVGGNIMFPIAMAKDVIEFYAAQMSHAADELSMSFFVVRPPGGAPGVVGLSVCHSGSEAEAERVVSAIRRLGTPLVDGIQGVDYVALQRSGDTDDPRARGTYLKSAFLPELSGDLINTIVDGLEGHPDRTSIIAYQVSGGAIGRVANNATSFSHRDAAGNLLGIVDWAHGSDPTEHMNWMRGFWKTRIEPFAQGFYANDLGVDDDAATINANYRGNYRRLVEVKNRYDPKNLFRLNANVQPTV